MHRVTRQESFCCVGGSTACLTIMHIALKEAQHKSTEEIDYLQHANKQGSVMYD